ncbi:MAG: type II toxin-antitoxin system HipA family toxin YjjJ [Rhodoferax sp.]|nr:type II toxin-antitoxin system HipA family toxin YjjJ [Rhodoferax sp.]
MPIDILHALRTWHKMPAGELLKRLQVSRPTLMRAMQALGQQVVTRGKARRTAYAARRTVRGASRPIPLFQIDREGRGTHIANIDTIYPQGCAIEFLKAPDWPLAGEMRDGWFDGLPYFLDDMRPQGFLGRNFARQHASLLQVSSDPQHWSEDDALHTLSLLGVDQPGNYILGEPAYRRFLDHADTSQHLLREEDLAAAYPSKAQEALALGLVESSAGGEFPKFTAHRQIDGAAVQVIVKFSGADTSLGTRRWADLLVCEQLALRTLEQELGIAAARTHIYQSGGRTFFETERFDRHGALGRSAVCSWSALNAALVGLANKSWIAGAAALRAQGMIDDASESAIQRIWHYGQLIGNTDMHDGNLAFLPGLVPAPVYDMLPMLYAPVRGMELPQREFAPELPLPAEQAAWLDAARAAIAFWDNAADDERVSKAFRKVCAQNARRVRCVLASPVLGATA